MASQRRIAPNRGRFIGHWEHFLARHNKQDGGLTRILDLLLALYGSPERFYHHFWHINGVVEFIEAARREVPEYFADEEVAAAIDLAALEHDAICQAGLEDNELRTAILASKHARLLGFSGRVGMLSHSYILDTTHRHLATTEAGSLVCDADLLTLAVKPPVFAAHTKLVRKEARHITDDAEFFKRQRAFFSGLLARPYIYQTPYARERHEPNARANLEEFIAR